MSKKSPRKKTSKKKAPRKRTVRKKKSLLRRILFKTLIPVFIILLAGIIYLDYTVRDRFEGKRWKLPAHVYARPLELYPGLQITRQDLTDELTLLGYDQVPTPTDQGSYHWQRHSLDLVTQDFTFGDGFQQSLALELTFSGKELESIQRQNTGEAISLTRLDPPLIGGIYPEKNEDRILVQLSDVPATVTDALIAVEDRRFYSHHGIDLTGIGRAIFNMATGGQIQGGSTITQQLAKNFFLSPERTIQRKLVEMVMALLLEVHYSKDEILETYLNEVYLGQDGNRSIHGFGLASHFFFNKPVSQLDLHEAALLVGLLKGPSYYNPRTQPERAKERRNLVLHQMAEVGDISLREEQAARNRPLGVLHRPVRGTTSFPAFMDLVQRQLRLDYRDEDLRSQGLRIFTTLDPRIQAAAEKSLQQRLKQLEQERNLADDSLQGAILVTSSQNAEVQAVVGGRDPRFEGFDRALDAKRPIGSLIKPVVFLTALEDSRRYTLATLIDDGPLVVKQNGSEDWTPHNFDKQDHGEVLLHDALVHSYNVSTVRLGQELGVENVINNLKKLGISRDLPTYPASLLGANTLSPLEVAQAYQTIAGGGFRTPLTAIREILDNHGEPLQHYPLKVEQTIAGEPTYLITAAMQDVVSEGTAKGLNQYLPADLGIAGKTGTTDDFRDSWFAGFSGDRVAVVWLGRDDNQPTGLTGASGAMTVWGDMMAQLNPQPLILAEPDSIETRWIDRPTGKLSSSQCQNAINLPFIMGSAPTEKTDCSAASPGASIKSWLKRIFQ